MTEIDKRALALRVADVLDHDIRNHEALGTDFVIFVQTLPLDEARALAAILREAVEGWRPIETAAAWQDLCEKDDRTSPDDYPNHALITREELDAYMRGAAVAIRALLGDEEG